ncbi:hypothetical protein [Thiomicrorhabdus aquaedulcis]|uniref:hypothetical protein n=1 Tax=Thiomicrorhabdus aquaedulcis TaxID=2211106 RepID=UPI000FDC3DEE|nr:hypothetical protein [Thiomicrorhabdus aquaedulcis]
MVKPALVLSCMNRANHFTHRKIVLRALLASMLGMGVFTLSGCAQTPQFEPKIKQTERAFSTDQAYCRSQALGQNNDSQGVSTLHLRLKTSGTVSYEDCMKAMGYQIKP